MTDTVRIAGTILLEGRQPIPVSLTVGPTAVVATAPNGDQLEVPTGALSVTPGGHDGDMLFLRAEGRPTITTSDMRLVEELARVGVPGMAEQLEAARAHRRSTARWARVSFGFAIVLGLVSTVAVMSIPACVVRSIGAVPISVDRAIGDLAVTDLTSMGAEVQDAEVRGFVAGLLDRVLEASPTEHSIRFHVVTNDEVNAFALPGGQVVVTTGLLRHAESPDAIAGVLAHELAHVERRHGLRHVAREAGFALALQLGLAVLGITDVGLLGGIAAQAATTAVSNGYSRDEEREADLDAVRTLHRAGLDPRALSVFFRGMAERGDGAVPAFAMWLSTHPDHEERIRDVEGLSATLPAVPPRPLAVDLARARSRLP